MSTTPIELQYYFLPTGGGPCRNITIFGAVDCTTNIVTFTQYVDGASVSSTAPTGGTLHIGTCSEAPCPEAYVDSAAITGDGLTALTAYSVSIDYIRDAVGGVISGASISDERLKELAQSDSYQVVTATYFADHVIDTGTVLWPDGSTGDYTTTSHNTGFATIDAWTVTHDASGKTVTQNAVTRNGTGDVTVRPALVVS